MIHKPEHAGHPGPRLHGVQPLVDIEDGIGWQSDRGSHYNGMFTTAHKALKAKTMSPMRRRGQEERVMTFRRNKSSFFRFNVLITVGCVITLLTVALAAARGLGAEANLISDGGFESGSRGWVAQGGKITLIADPHKPTRETMPFALWPLKRENCGQGVCTARIGSTWQRVGVTCCRHGSRGKARQRSACMNTPFKIVCRSSGNVFPCRRPNLWMPSGVSSALSTCPPTNASCPSAFYAQLAGENGQMLIDDVGLQACPEPDVGLSLGRVPAMASAARPLPVSLSLRGQIPNPQVELLLRTEEGIVLARQTARLTKDASPSLSLSVPAQTDGCALLSVVEKTSGAVAMGRVDVCPDGTYRDCGAAAAAVRLEGPAHLVFVGDSLTALFRGHNYVDKVRWWLQGRFGETIEVTNAGVGGDTIIRVKERLEKDVLGLKPKPTHVFIFLGHNDSKLKSTSEYREPVVLPADFEKTYRDVVRAIQTTLGAKVVVISATSSVYEITQATAAESGRRGKTHNLFGKPEALEQFNGIARKVASDLGADYLDVYEPFRTHPQKASLFTPDGVHINERGNRLMTL